MVGRFATPSKQRISCPIARGENPCEARLRGRLRFGVAALQSAVRQLFRTYYGIWRIRRSRADSNDTLAMHHVGHAHGPVQFGMPVDPAGLDVIRNDSQQGTK